MGDAIHTMLDGLAPLAGIGMTWFLHSTLVLGMVWLVQALRAPSPSTEERLWRLALAGSLVTTAFAHALPELRSSAVIELDVLIVSLGGGGGQAATGSTTPAMVMAGCWLSGTIVAATLLAVGLLRTRRLLADRVPADAATVAWVEEIVHATGFAAPLRVTVSSRLASPVALGRREICLPEGFSESLAPSQRAGVLAHELAHLVRRDPLVQRLLMVVSVVGWFQPLLHVARRRLRDVAEVRADELAVSWTGNPVALAEGLVRTARAVLGKPRIEAAPSAVRSKSGILYRVERLLSARSSPFGWLALAVCVAGVLAVAWLAPATMVGSPLPGTSSTMGSLDSATIKGTIQARQASFKACYQAALAVDPAIEGSLVVTFGIGTDGAVTYASIEEATVDDPVLLQCITDSFASLTFPAPEGGGSLVVRYPLVFDHQ